MILLKLLTHVVRMAQFEPNLYKVKHTADFSYYFSYIITPEFTHNRAIVNKIREQKENGLAP
jgi:hypothetical protein